ncbi:16S rRNA (cytosine(1402)-N(4))-methyltransferase RsmH, partial [Patescibacteria group bacterium AH-259-L07]|nr:16S rRNA (cytosine(1402)-N(4))-methyltransferase RsmH [Patescibacteria group bacterium AH-259-L07]
DMRFRPDKGGITAKKIVNHYTYEDLATIFKTYGGERYANRIAHSIIQARKKQKIISTQELRVVVTQALGRQMHIKSLARIFQALRIAVNNELENLKTVLTQSVAILEPQGRIAVISYHSLEDKIVKTFFKTSSHVQIITKKPIVPTSAEIKKNRRSRSAKLRVAEKIK